MSQHYYSVDGEQGLDPEGFLEELAFELSPEWVQRERRPFSRRPWLQQMPSSVVIWSVRHTVGLSVVTLL